MTALRDKMMQDLELADYAARTQRIYVDAISDFAKFFRRSPEQMGADEVRSWARHLADKHGVRGPRLRQHFSALKFLYTKTLYRPDAVSFLSFPRSPVKLPVVLSAQEVSNLLAAFTVLKHRVFCMTLYATGLRLSEALKLEPKDIHAARGVIHIRHGKGGRERLVKLCPPLLAELRAYWKLERPPAPWLFPSSKGKPLHPSVIRRALKRAAASAGINKHVTPHIVRHSSATHMLEQGTELRLIQVLLGHESIKSTTHYARVSAAMIAKVRSPLELVTKAG